MYVFLNSYIYSIYLFNRADLFIYLLCFSINCHVISGARKYLYIIILINIETCYSRWTECFGHQVAFIWYNVFHCRSWWLSMHIDGSLDMASVDVRRHSTRHDATRTGHTVPLLPAGRSSQYRVQIHIIYIFTV